MSKSETTDTSTPAVQHVAGMLPDLRDQVHQGGQYLIDGAAMLAALAAERDALRAALASAPAAADLLAGALALDTRAAEWEAHAAVAHGESAEISRETVSRLKRVALWLRRTVHGR